MHIRPMTVADLEPALVVTATVGWGDLRPQLSFCLSHADCHPFVAEVDGEVVGTAVGTQKGEVGWLGYVIVAEPYRRRGIGGALAEAASCRLEQLGCRGLLLIATALGRPVYERLGFAVAGEYVSLRGPALPAPPATPRLRPLAPGDLPAVYELDRHATGEDRSAQVRAFADGGTVLVEADGRVAGYLIPTPWGEGPAVAPLPEDGCLLLDLVRGLAGGAGRTELRIRLPEANRAARDYLARAGFAETDRSARMVRGEPVAWRPEWLWGRFGGAMG